MATEAVIKEVNYGESVKLNKEKQKLKIGNLIAHHFYKILICISHLF